MISSGNKVDGDFVKVLLDVRNLLLRVTYTIIDAIHAGIPTFFELLGT